MSSKQKKPTIKKLIKDILPKEDIFNEYEVKIYDELLDVYLSDFDQDELTSSDMDDIINLAMNKVLSIRLLKDSKGNVDKQLDIAAALEKFDKRNEKIKESLSSRRRDRINPNELQGFSIVDLAVGYDQKVKSAHLDKMDKLRKEEQDLLESRKAYSGNRYDTIESEETDKSD